MRVFLIGLPGVGKSRTAKELSLLMNIPFVDLDKLIEKKAGMTISEIFSNYGEDYFRELETNTLKEYSMVDNIIVSYSLLSVNGFLIDFLIFIKSTNVLIKFLLVV